jgi:hypothetical protein
MTQKRRPARLHESVINQMRSANWSVFSMDIATEKLPLETQNYMLGIVSFLDKIDHYQSLLKGLPTYAPLVETLDELRGALDEAIEWLNEYMETDEDEDEDEDESMETEMDYATLVENLKDDAASTLEDALGALSAISLNIPELEWKDATDDEDEDDESDDEEDVRVVIQALDDMQNLADNIASDLHEHGYDLYHVFIGALFPCM